MSLYRFAFVATLLVACGGKIDTTEDTRTRQVGTVNGSSSGDPGSSSGVSSSSSSSGSTINPVCGTAGVIPFEEDFESGAIGEDWTVNTPSAFTVDFEQPITGSASLRVKPTAASYIARKMKNNCAARLQFTTRVTADFLKSGGNLARIMAGSRRFTIQVQPGGSVSLTEERFGYGAIGAGFGPPSGDLFADDPTKFVLDVDLASKKVTFGFGSGVSSSGTRVTDMSPDDPAGMDAPSITSIELGSTPGFAQNPGGLYWIDDVSID